MTSSKQPTRLAVLSLLLCLGMVTGCGPSTVIVEGRVPPPLMEQLPLTLGIWFDEEFSNHEFFDQAKTRAESSWLVKTGDAQVQMWDTLLTGMFDDVIYMRAKPDPGELNQVVDGVLIPHVDDLQYAIPAHTNIKVYEIWMRYRFELVTSGGEPIAEWTMTSYGKTPTAFLRSDKEAVNLAAIMALRDAGANFAISFSQVPELQEWLQQRGLDRQRAAP